MVYDDTQSTNSDIERALCTGGLQLSGRTGARERIRSLEGSTDLFEGFGSQGGRGLEDGEGHRHDLILGWSPNEKNVLLGESTYISRRSCTNLFMPSNDRRAIPCDGGDTMSIYKKLEQKMHNLSASRAANYLNYSFDAGFEELEMNGLVSSPIQLMSDLPGLHPVPAREVAPISFWGGPPGKQRWYDGSLLTVLIDHILRASENGNKSLLERFLTLYT